MVSKEFLDRGDIFQRSPKIRVRKLFGTGYIDSGIRNGRSDRSFGPPNKRGGGEGGNGVETVSIFPEAGPHRNIKVGSGKGGTRTWYNESEEIPGIGIIMDRGEGRRKM